jgi:8-oxo-dGTP pyrophosphatase MutT (NUDIX family)
MSEKPTAVAHPAATVVLLRDGDAGCEALLVRRNAQLAFHGGAWVFPGGRIDADDHAAVADSGDVIAAARHAAAREAHEEAGVVITPASLVLFARWITPVELPKRFDTWFFAGRAGNELVRVDGGEIHEHRWFRPADALAARHAGEIELPPPTFVTLSTLVGYDTADAALAALARGKFESFAPRLHIIPDGACTVYEGDVAYDAGDIDAPGARHRLWILESGWRYERTVE